MAKEEMIHVQGNLMNRHRKKWWTEELRAYLILVLPAVLIYYAVMAFPFLYSLVLSLTNYTSGELTAGNIHFIGFKHYLDMFEDPYFWISLKNNFYIIFISVFGQIPIGFILAYILHRKHVKMAGFFQSMIYLPTIISTIVVGILWQSFFSPYGSFTEIIQHLIPGWENNLFIGGLSSMHICRLVIKDNKVVGEERLLESENQRFRDITQGKDGALYAVTDGGRLYRIGKK